VSRKKYSEPFRYWRTSCTDGQTRPKAHTEGVKFHQKRVSSCKCISYRIFNYFYTEYAKPLRSVFKVTYPGATSYILQIRTSEPIGFLCLCSQCKRIRRGNVPQYEAQIFSLKLLWAEHL